MFEALYGIERGGGRSCVPFTLRQENATPVSLAVR